MTGINSSPIDVRLTLKVEIWVYGHLDDKPTERQTTERQSNGATANWATHFGQLGDNIGREKPTAQFGSLNTAMRRLNPQLRSIQVNCAVSLFDE